MCTEKYSVIRMALEPMKYILVRKTLLNLLLFAMYPTFCNFHISSFLTNLTPTPRTHSSPLNFDVMFTHFLENWYNWCAIDVWNASKLNLEQIYRASACFEFFSKNHCAFKDWLPLTEYWSQLNTPWILIRCMWMPLSECDLSLNVIEWIWTPLSECEHLLNAIECMWIPFGECEHSLNAFECEWMPLSE